MNENQHVLVEKRSNLGGGYKVVTLSNPCEPGNRLYRGVGTSYRAAYAQAYQHLRMGMESRLRGYLERGEVMPWGVLKTAKTGLRMWYVFQDEHQAEGKCPCCGDVGEVQIGVYSDGEPKIVNCSVCGDEDLDRDYDEWKEERHVH